MVPLHTHTTPSHLTRFRGSPAIRHAHRLCVLPPLPPRPPDSLPYPALPPLEQSASHTPGLRGRAGRRRDGGTRRPISYGKRSSGETAANPSRREKERRRAGGGGMPHSVCVVPGRLAICAPPLETCECCCRSCLCLSGFRSRGWMLHVSYRRRSRFPGPPRRIRPSTARMVSDIQTVTIHRGWTPFPLASMRKMVDTITPRSCPANPPLCRCEECRSTRDKPSNRRGWCWTELCA